MGHRGRIALFDFGGVVIRSPFELHDHGWRGPFDPEHDDLWQRSQAGEITEREYWHLRTSEIHRDAADPTYTFMRTLYERPEAEVVRPEVADLIAGLRADGHRVAALTNDLTAFHPPAWIERMTIVRSFDPLIDLSHAGVLKPQPAAFAQALAELGADGEDVVLLDDQIPNVDGARAAGLRAVWFDVTAVPDSVARMQEALAA